MSSDTDENPVKIVLDTNILISALGFGGKPREIFLLALKKKIQGVISVVLLAELNEVILKKFPKLEPQLSFIEKQIKDKFLVVKPHRTLSILKDEADNRVLEAAMEGNCDYIITGDKELLALKSFQNIKITNPQEFFREIGVVENPQT